MRHFNFWDKKTIVQFKELEEAIPSFLWLKFFTFFKFIVQSLPYPEKASIWAIENISASFCFTVSLKY